MKTVAVLLGHPTDGQHLSSSEAGSDNAEKGSSRQKIDELM
jgi:hypothetical protein